MRAIGRPAAPNACLFAGRIMALLDALDAETLRAERAEAERDEARIKANMIGDDR